MTELLAQPEKNFKEITRNNEITIQKILHELEAYKEEQSRFKEQLLNVIEDNNRISSKIDVIGSVSSFQTACDHDQLTNDAISNLKQQVQHLKEERSTINCLWKTSQETIANLETEIKNYRNQLFKPSAFAEVKEKYCATIKALEDVIRNQKTEICKQANTIRDLTEHKTRSNDRIKELQSIIADQEKKLSESQQLAQTNSSLKQKLQAILQTNSELEMSTNLAKSMIDERFTRERNALEKLQEALLIAETAVAEKEEAIKREVLIKEECETLASTIGQVMEEAARKVEQSIDSLKTRYEDNEKDLIKKNQDAMEQVEKQMKATRAAEARCSILEQKLKEVLRENTKLDKDLQIASEAIIEMELKVEATEKLLREDKKSERICEERERQIRQYMQDNNQIKERWKYTMEDVSQKFGSEIQRLQKENSNLRAEIQSQRLKVHKLNY